MKFKLVAKKNKYIQLVEKQILKVNYGLMIHVFFYKQPGC